MNLDLIVGSLVPALVAAGLASWAVARLPRNAKRRANLEGVHLRGANLEGADLTSACGNEYTRPSLAKLGIEPCPPK